MARSGVVRGGWGLLLVLVAAGPARAGWEVSTSGNGQTSGMFQISAYDADNVMAVGSQDSGGGNQSAVIMISHTGGEFWFPMKPTALPPGPMSFELYTCVEMVSAQKAFVGAMGHIFVTENGGMEWTPWQESGWGPLRGPIIGGIRFAGPDVGYLVGTGGLIRKTTDGGATWNPVDSPVADAEFSGLWVVDANHAWAWAGSSQQDPDTGELTGYTGGTLVRTTNGTTWEALFQGEERFIGRAFFLNPTEGWMVSQSMAGPRLQKTTDGGRTWTDMPVPPGAGGPAEDIMDVWFFDRCEGFLVAERLEQNTLLFHTVDRGATWTQIDPAFLAVPYPLPIPARSRLNNLEFVNRDVGFAGGTYEAVFRYASDGPGPDCGGGTLPDGGTDPGTGGGGDEGCGCRAAGGGGPASVVFAALFVGLFFVRFRRRR